MTLSRAARPSTLLVVLGLTLGGLVVAPLLSAARTPPVAVGMAKSAEAFLASLDGEQRKKATFPIEEPTRAEWFFTPRARQGLPIKQMTEPQRKLAHALVRSGLSALGYQKTTAIMGLEDVLAEMEKDPVKRDHDLYYVSVFGTPDPKGTWAWRFEGHHVSMHMTIVDGTIVAAAPNFFGTNPGEVRQGPKKGLRVLGKEEDLGRALMTALDEGQRKTALFDTVAPKEIVTGNAAKVDPLAPVGLPVSAMKPAQKKLVEQLLALHASHLSPELAEGRLARIKKAGLDAIRFGWAGGVEKGAPHYYRLQGPTFLIEYDNTQNDANHIHVVFRDFDGDFGRDLLREHVQKAHAVAP